MRKYIMSFIGTVLIASAPAHASHIPVVASFATVPMILKMNRPYVDLTATGPNGRPVHARFYLDTGGGAIILSKNLATRLGLKPEGAPSHEEGVDLVATRTPAIRIGGMRVNLLEPATAIDLDAPETLDGNDAQGMLPMRMLARYHIVFDYPQRQFTVAREGQLQPHGVPVQTFIGDSWMPVVTFSVDGIPHNFLLDTGARYCIMSIALLDQWQTKHADWPHVRGAYGSANMLLGPMDTKSSMLRVGPMQWGPFRLVGVGAVSRPANVYEKWMSQVVGHSIQGSIGGNVLRSFRVDIDYPKRQIYLAGQPGIADTPINMVGVILEPIPGGYVIAGGYPGLKGVQIGDRLLKVGDLNIGRATLATIMAALYGKLGETRLLVLQRNGKQFKVKAPVQHLL